MSTVQLYTDALLKHYANAVTLLYRLNAAKKRGEILQLRVDIERCIKEMKATYYDLVEAGGSQHMKALIKYFENQFEESPNFDDKSPFPEMTDDTAAREQISVVEKTDLNHYRMVKKSGRRRFPLEPYEPVPSSLHFQKGDIVRTPMNTHGLIMPIWFYVDSVIQDEDGVVLRGWRLGEDQKARIRYRDLRIVRPDQYTKIDRRGVSREEVGIHQICIRCITAGNTGGNEGK